MGSSRDRTRSQPLDRLGLATDCAIEPSSLTLVMLNIFMYLHFYPVNLQHSRFKQSVKNSLDPDQMAFRSQLIWIYSVFKKRINQGSAGQGLSFLFSFFTG